MGAVVGGVQIKHHVKSVNTLKSILKNTDSTRIQVMCSIGKKGAYLASSCKALADIDYRRAFPQHFVRTMQLSAMQEMVDSLHVTVGMVDPTITAAEIERFYKMTPSERMHIGACYMERVREVCAPEHVQKVWANALLKCI